MSFHPQNYGSEVSTMFSYFIGVLMYVIGVLLLIAFDYDK